MIAAGGTGGHIYPGLALAQSLKDLYPEAEIHFVGTARGLENRIVPQAGYPLHKIPVGMLNPSAGVKEILKTLVKLPSAFYRSWQLLRVLKPRFLLGVGGYASGPVVLTGSLMGFRSYIWEPNAMPGMANKILARFVDEAFVVFDEAKKFLKCKTVTRAGMPVRKSIENLKASSESPTPGVFRLFAFGGSQGARGINENLSQALVNHPETLKDMQVIHQTGKLDYERIKQRYAEKGLGRDFPVKVLEYVEDMENKYSWADLILSRSGTGTLSELAAAGKASLLIPFPAAADNHQQKNAEVLVRAGAAEMILQKDLNPEILLQKIQQLKNDSEKRSQMIREVRKFHEPQAAEKLASLLWEKSK